MASPEMSGLCLAQSVIRAVMRSTSAGVIWQSFQRRDRVSKLAPSSSRDLRRFRADGIGKARVTGPRKLRHEAMLDLADQRGAFEYQRRVKLQKVAPATIFVQAASGQSMPPTPMSGRRPSRRK